MPPPEYSLLSYLVDLVFPERTHVDEPASAVEEFPSPLADLALAETCTGVACAQLRVETFDAYHSQANIDPSVALILLR